MDREECIDVAFNLSYQLIWGAKLSGKWGTLEYDIKIKKYILSTRWQKIYVGTDLNIALFEMEMLRST
jgi:hypothetical protein